MKVDVHAHIMSAALHEAVARLPGVTTVPNLWGAALKRDGTHVVSYNEAWYGRDHPIREMDAKGIDMRLLSLTSPSVYIFEAKNQAEVARRVNDETIAFCRGRTDRLRALPSLPLGDVDAAIAELDRVAGAPEVAGIAMGSNAAGVPLSDPRFEPLWARIDALRIPVVEHPMHPTFAADIQDRNFSVVLGFWFDTQLCVARLIQNGVFERYPNFPFVVAHTGSGLLSALERLDWAAERWATELPQPASHYAKRLYFDTCGTYAPLLMEAHAAVGADHMLFGTDYPYIDIDFAHVNDLPIAAADKEAINGATAARIFGLER